jgi:very-short-patch-repair endonuclease
MDILIPEEVNYAKNSWTHIDLLIYNTLNKEPILGVEVDGTEYHKAESRQSERDRLKDRIFEKCGLTLMRFRTDGSMEIDKIDKKLNELMNK